MKRRARLVTRTELRRSPMPPRETPLASSGPVKAKRRDTGPRKSVKYIIWVRADGCCEQCGFGPAFGVAWVMDIHHRRPRGIGGTSEPAANLPSNLVLLHRSCHDWLESNRTWALTYGWLVPQGTDPATVPVSIRGRWCLLTNTGQYQDIAEEAS